MSVCIYLCVCAWQSIKDRETVIRQNTTNLSLSVYILRQYKQLNKKNKTTDGIKVVCAHISVRLRCGKASNESLVSIKSFSKTVSIHSQRIVENLFIFSN